MPAPNEPTFPAAIEIPAEPVYWTGMALETIKRMAHALYESPAWDAAATS